MIKLYKFPAAFGLTDPSPFCVKVESFLRMAGLPYESICLTDPRKGPKGKLPFIQDGEKSIADSTFILKYLIDAYQIPIDADLNPEQQGAAFAIARMLEEHLYWAIVFERWIDEANWKKISAQFFGGMPIVVRSIVPMLARFKVKSALHGQGLGRHSAGEIHELAVDDLQALSAFLGNKDFICGERPSSYDAPVYAFLSSILYCTLDSRVKRVILERDNLKNYCERFRAAYYPELGAA